MSSDRLWYQLSISSTLSELNTSSSGLTTPDAEERLETYGLNKLTIGSTISPWHILAEQFKNVLIIILLIAITLSAILGHTIESIVITIIVLFAVVLGFVQEYRAEKAIDALKKMATPTATALRDGIEKTIPASQIVPGDMMILHAGDKVPADARIVQSVNMQTEEAPLTGESLPVAKIDDAIDADNLQVGDMRNMVFSGTSVTYGRGTAVAVATGLETEFGKIAKMLRSVETEKTPLQINLDKIGKTLAKATLVIVVLIVALGLFRGMPFIEMLVFGIALAVAVVPEALPAVVTISLAIGVQRMVKRNALIRKLPAVETLGSTSIICSDKTGTLTRDEMTVKELFIAGKVINISGSGYIPEGEFTAKNQLLESTDPLLQTLLTAGLLVNDTDMINEDGEWNIKGDPTEGAITVAAAKAGLDRPRLNTDYPRIYEIPFTSESKRMTTLHQTGNTITAYAKGAPEVIISACTHIWNGIEDIPITDININEILGTIETMSLNALRVLAIAQKINTDIQSVETGMTFLGLIGMIDPPREEVKDAILICENAGIRPIMITGDHPSTAKAIATELGLLKSGLVMTGAELEQISDEELREKVKTIEVYARVSPAHKLRIVTALQDNHHIAAMTGDGINDAPALKKADIGIAMGITGTDVSKEASDMMLIDDNFTSIVAAIEEGRAIFDNIKKYLMYLLSSNIGEVLLMAAATLFGLPLPLSAVQILYVNLATDGLPALALAIDPAEKNLMHKKPRNNQQSIFTRSVVTLMLAAGIWSAVINIGLFSWALNSGRVLSEAMTMSFVLLILIEFFKAYIFRSDRYSVFQNPFINKWLNLAILWEIALLTIIVYVPFMHNAFGTYSLPANDLTIIIALAFTIIPFTEVIKWWIRKTEEDIVK